MRAARFVISFALAAAVNAHACTPQLSGGGRTLEAGPYTIAYRSLPAKIPLGQPFSLFFAVCANNGAAAPASVNVDAQMPEHRHGMNYRPSIKPEAAGGYRADGLMFHMPGRWELIFEVRANGKTERATSSEVIE